MENFAKMEFSPDRRNDYNPINSLVLLCIVYEGQFMNGLSSAHGFRNPNVRDKFIMCKAVNVDGKKTRKINWFGTAFARQR